MRFKRDSKEKALSKIDVGTFDFQDIGIAADEKDRQNQLNEKKRSILIEMGITEKSAREISENYGLLSPIYKENARDGCALCPQAIAKEREKWFSENPHVISKILEMQKTAEIERPGIFPLRNHQNFL